MQVLRILRPIRLRWDAKSSTLAAIIPAAEKNGRCEIRTSAYARKVPTDVRGRVDGVI
jgi:hypothetical protein